MSNWIKVEIVPARSIGAGPMSWVSTMSYRIFCVACGHDDFRYRHGAAMVRAEQMHRDHIPYSPDGTLSCYRWEPPENEQENSDQP